MLRSLGYTLPPTLLDTGEAGKVPGGSFYCPVSVWNVGVGSGDAIAGDRVWSVDELDSGAAEAGELGWRRRCSGAARA